MAALAARVLVDHIFPYKFSNGRVSYTYCSRPENTGEISYIKKLLQESSEYDALVVSRQHARFLGLASRYLKYKHAKIIVYEFQYKKPSGLQKQLYHHLIWKKTVRGLDSVIVHAQFETEAHKKLFNAPNTRFSLVLYGITPLKHVGPTRDGYIFSAGRDRDYETLVKSLENLDVPCVIVGPNNHPVLSSITNKNITVYTEIPKEQYLNLANNAKAIVVPLDPEQQMHVGLITVLEALSLGKPLIVTDFPGISDYIQTKGCLTVPPKDSSAMSNAIRQLYNAPFEDLVKMGEIGHQHVKENFENRHFQMRFEEEIINVVNGNAD